MGHVKSFASRDFRSLILGLEHVKNGIAAKEHRELKNREIPTAHSVIFVFFCGKKRLLNGHGFHENALHQSTIGIRHWLTGMLRWARDVT
jgi:hypothetical protein